MNQNKLYIISGCNGAGKTTASYNVLPEILECKEFVNADEIAKGLSPFQPEAVSIEAGRIMLQRINDLLDQNKSFAFETTLSTKSYKNKIKLAQSKGYKVVLLFFWLQNVSLAKQRVAIRVEEGGHNIDDTIIERRYFGGVKNLFDIYIPLVDDVMIFDNSEGNYELVAEKGLYNEIEVINFEKYNLIKSLYNEK
ncbi:MAG: zeta toxin family protein [Fluviicola sp.]|nr:zeta toxin family protein [Fluviicola sp.]